MAESSKTKKNSNNKTSAKKETEEKNKTASKKEIAEKNEKAASFLTRLISSIVLAIVGGGCVALGGIPLICLMMFVMICGIYELLRVFQMEKMPLAIVAYVAAAAYDIGLYLNFLPHAMFFVICFFLILLTIYVLSFPKYEIKQVMEVFFSFVYLTLCLGYFYPIRKLEHGLLFAILIVVCACGNDIFAYLVGILIGKHKMFPKLSPKKSVEGFIGGILGAAVLGAIYGAIFSKYADYGEHNYILIFAIVSAVGALPAVVGDLAASAIKRNYGIKDYGNLIPGHGGIMDRFDSMIFTAPIIYYLVTFILQIKA